MRALLALAVLASLVAAGNNTILVNRCDPMCQKCETIMELQGDKCHDEGIIFKHAAMMHCKPAPERKPCVRESAWFHLGGAVCQGDPLMEGHRECGKCFEDFRGEFVKYDGCGTSNMTVKRGCDFGCQNCNFEFPIREGQCVKHFDMAFSISMPERCDSSIEAYHFKSPFCEGLPDFDHSVFDNTCYVLFGHAHTFNCK